MLDSQTSEIAEKGRRAKVASYIVATVSSERKNRFLIKLAEDLTAATDVIFAANKADIEKARAGGMASGMLDRLTLNEKRLGEITSSLKDVAELDDPIGERMEEWSRPNGLRLVRVRVPLGVVGIIYEARPNVTIDSAALSIKTGNACLLRGSSSAIETNKAVVAVIRHCLKSLGLPEDAVQLIEDTRRESILELLRLNSCVDVVIPRGGADLIQYVVGNSSVPVIETGAGNCHVYLHQDADPQMAIDICVNAKTQRPSVCNAAETFLVHRAWAERHFKQLIETMQAKDVECRGCAESLQLTPSIKAAELKDWDTEYSELIVAIKIVDSLQEAIDHINTHGTRHSESIVTKDTAAVEEFFMKVDAATLYHNASTRFTDGFEFGFGAEIGISTQKLHARGPMALKELSSYKYLGYGNGQIRG